MNAPRNKRPLATVIVLIGLLICLIGVFRVARIGEVDKLGAIPFCAGLALAVVGRLSELLDWTKLGYDYQLRSSAKRRKLIWIFLGRAAYTIALVTIGIVVASIIIAIFGGPPFVWWRF
jgi:hypothetical protein